MKRKIFILMTAMAFVLLSAVGCGKEEGTKYEYEENVILENDETKIKLLNLQETEEEFKINFALENVEKEDVKVTVYDPEEKDITEELECSYDEEKDVLSIKGDISQFNTAEVAFNYNTSLKVKDLKNEEFKYLLTEFEDDYGCKYLGDLEDFGILEEELAEGEEGEEGEGGENESSKPSKKRATVDEIFDELEGTWVADNKTELSFYKGSGEKEYYAKLLSVENGYDELVSYFDETSCDTGAKIRFITGNGGVGSCRELILSEDKKKLSYITGIQKNAEGEFENVTVEYSKK